MERFGVAGIDPPKIFDGSRNPLPDEVSFRVTLVQERLRPPGRDERGVVKKTTSQDENKYYHHYRMGRRCQPAPTVGQPKTYRKRAERLPTAFQILSCVRSGATALPLPLQLREEYDAMDAFASGGRSGGQFAERFKGNCRGRYSHTIASATELSPQRELREFGSVVVSHPSDAGAYHPPTHALLAKSAP